MTRQGARPQSPKKSNAGLLWVAGVAVVAVAGLIGLSIWTSQKSDKAAPATSTVKTDTEQGADRNVWGSKTAKVELVEFGDYL
jgi:hypothetical protein